MKIIGIGGLPGSGKTYLGKKLAEKYGYILFDDINIETVANLKHAIKNNKSVIITDPYFCFIQDRQCAEKTFKTINPTCEIEWILFENDPESCKSNVKRRNDGRKVNMLINTLSKKYNTDGVTNVVPVWKAA